MLRYVLLTLSLVSQIQAFPTGAPLTACENLGPIHKGQTALKAEDAPYKIVVKATEWSPGSPIEGQATPI